VNIKNAVNWTCLTKNQYCVYSTEGVKSMFLIPSYSIWTCIVKMYHHYHPVFKTHTFAFWTKIWLICWFWTQGLRFELTGSQKLFFCMNDSGVSFIRLLCKYFRFIDESLGCIKGPVSATPGVYFVLWMLAWSATTTTTLLVLAHFLCY
jgi:hypothetical protein